MDNGSLIQQHISFAPPIAFGLGWMEVGILLLVVLLVFGNKLPGMARNLGRSFIEFRKGVKGIDDNGDHTLPGSEEAKQISGDSNSRDGQ